MPLIERFYFDIFAALMLLRHAAISTPCLLSRRRHMSLPYLFSPFHTLRHGYALRYAAVPPPLITRRRLRCR